MSNARRITLGDVLGTVGIVSMLFALAIPMTIGSRRTSREMQNSTQLRGIHQGFILESQGRNGWYTGLDAAGAIVGVSVVSRFKTLVNGNYFTPGFLINPMEAGPKAAWMAGPFSAANYSYAALQVPAQGLRHAEWKDTTNTLAPVLSDRNTGTAQTPTSVFSNAPISGSGSGCFARTHGPGWVGSVVRNDNSTAFEQTPVLKTAFGSGEGAKEFARDALFVAEGVDDAFLIHEGS